MNELLKKIYENVICYEKDALQMGERMDTVVNDLIEPYTEHFKEQDIETVKELMYAICLKSEQEGFQLGIQYTLKMLIQLLADL